MADATTIKKKPFTPIGVFSFPHLFKPRAMQPGAEEKFSVTVIFDEAAQKTAEYKKMKQAVLDAAEEMWPGKAADMFKAGKIRSPFRDAAEKDQFAGYEAGMTFINAWSKQPPDVLDGRKNRVASSDVFPGVRGRISGTLSPSIRKRPRGSGCLLYHRAR